MSELGAAYARTNRDRSETKVLPEAFARPLWVSDRLFPFQSRFTTVGDARIHYVDRGSGPTLLLLHGSPMWSFLFRNTIGALSNQFRCIAVDMPGLGLSSAPVARGQEFERMANYYQKLVRQLALSDFILVMHATAGPPGLRMAISERDRIRGMVITNSFGWSMREYPTMWRFVRIVSSPPFRFLTEWLNLLPRITIRAARTTGKFDGAERGATLGPYQNRDARRHLASLLYGLKAEVPFFERLEADLKALRALPTLLLYGAKDHGYQAGFLDRWKRLLPNNSVTLLSNSAHFPQEDEPDAYTSALLNWLKCLSDSPAALISGAQRD